jgi:hypothetical protein
MEAREAARLKKKQAKAELEALKKLIPGVSSAIIEELLDEVAAAMVARYADLTFREAREAEAAMRVAGM